MKLLAIVFLVIINFDRIPIRPLVLFCICQPLHVPLLLIKSGMDESIFYSEHRGRPAEADLECSTLEPPLLNTSRQTGNIGRV